MIFKSLQIILAAQYYMVTFLPTSHPQTYLPMLLRLWEGINSYMYDERMLAFLSQLSEMHVDPTKSDPRLVDEIPDDAVGAGEARVHFDKADLKSNYLWTGITKDVGIFTDEVRHGVDFERRANTLYRSGNSSCASVLRAWVCRFSDWRSICMLTILQRFLSRTRGPSQLVRLLTVRLVSRSEGCLNPLGASVCPCLL